MFLSHTSELRRYPERGRSYVDQAERAVIKAEHLVIDMEDFPARDQTPAAFDEERVQQADVYVGIYGARYGTPARERPEKSYTELEFDAATAAGIHRLIFIIDLDSDELKLPAKALIDHHHGAKQAAFLQRVRKDCGLLVNEFRSPDDLWGQVYHALKALAATEGAPGPDAPEPTASDVPDLLPYAPDRHAQEMRMAEALKRFPATETARPLVVILHGEENQEGRRFRERYRETTLQSLLNPAGDVRIYPLSWPKNAPLGERFDTYFHDWVVSQFNSKVVGPDDPDLVENLGPMVLWTELYAKEWGRQSGRHLSYLCRFWQECKTLPGCCLMHWITINYDSSASHGAAIPWLRWLDVRYWRGRLRMAHIRATLGRLERAQAEGSLVLVLQELTSVCRSDAEIWAHSQAVTKYLEGRSPLPLEEAVRTFYRDRAAKKGQGEIPMEELGKFLKSTLPLAKAGVL